MKIKFVFLSVALVLLSSCSNSSDIDDAVSAQEEDNSPVAIRLSSGPSVSVTRAAIESEDDGKFSCDSLGVFMLAISETTYNPYAEAISWVPGSVFDEEAWLDNVQAKVNKSDGEVTFWENNAPVTRYYPLDNWYAYRFYAYQPFRENTVVDQLSNQRVVHYTNLDGTQDIICGSTAASANPLAYCSRYFHQIAHKEEVPNMHFNHMQMRLQFYLVGIPDTISKDPEVLDYTECNKMILQGLWVKDVPTSADLVVATSPATEPKLTYKWGSNDPKANIYLRSKVDDKLVITPQKVDGEKAKEVGENEGQPIGSPIMLPVTDGVYKLGMTFSIDGSTEIFTINTIDLRPNHSFEAGKTYKVKIKVGGPTKIQLHATLDQWDNNGGEASLDLN